jgi:hypothetical protein
MDSSFIDIGEIYHDLSAFQAEGAYSSAFNDKSGRSLDRTLKVRYNAFGNGEHDPRTPILCDVIGFSHVGVASLSRPPIVV